MMYTRINKGSSLMQMSSFAFEHGIAEKEGDIWNGGRKLKRSPFVTTLEYIC